MEFARSSVDRDKILIYERELRKDKFRLEHQSRQRHRMGRYPFWDCWVKRTSVPLPLWYRLGEMGTE